MIDRLQYYFLKLHKFTKEKIHRIKYCNDFPKNEHFAKAKKIQYLNYYETKLNDTSLFERTSYKKIIVKQDFWRHIAVYNVWKIFDENDNVIWEKTVKL